MRYQGRSGLALRNHTRRHGRNAHSTLTTGAGQLGPDNLVAHNLGWHIFKALALLAANLALVLPAVRTDFFLRLQPLRHRLQHSDRWLSAHPLRRIRLSHWEHYLSG